jgi:hypothetical protein
MYCVRSLACSYHYLVCVVVVVVLDLRKEDEFEEYDEG